jgi:tetratricopeptide (TPR) repeat protein
MNTSASPETIHELFNRAFALHQANQPKAAQPLYNEVLARDPRHAHAIHSLGVIASEDGRRKEAIELFQRAIAINGKDAIFYHNLARTLQADGRSTEAVQSLRKAVEVNPEFLGAWQALAEIHYSLDNTTEAARAIQKVADLKTKTAESHNQKGLTLVKEKRLKEAVEEFRAGMACNPRGAGLYFNAGNVLSVLGQHADAIACLMQAASLEPKTSRVYVFLSNAHYRKGDLDAALRARAKAWQLDPTLPDEQFEVSASPIVAHPKRPVAMGGTPTRTTTLSLTQAIQQAVERHNAGDGASAEMLYRKVLEVDPVNADALHLLGVLLHQRGDHRGALELIDRVVVRGNASANVHANRASVLISLGEFDAAEASGRRALEIDPIHKGAQDNVALAQRKRQSKSHEAVADDVLPAAVLGEEAQKKSSEGAWRLRPLSTATASNAGNRAPRDSQHRDAIKLDANKDYPHPTTLLRERPPIDSSDEVALAPGYVRRETDGNANLSAPTLIEAQKAPSTEVPLESEFTYQHALRLYRKGQLAEAYSVCSSVLQAEPFHFECLTLLGLISFRQGDQSAALASLDSAITASPAFAPAYSNSALVLLKLGRLSEALAKADCAFACAPDSPEVLRVHGKILAALSRHSEAVADYDRALALDCTSIGTHIDRAIALAELKRFDEASRGIELALRLDSRCLDALLCQGTILLDRGQPERALKSFEHTLTLKPNSSLAYYNRGNALHQLDRLPEALDSYERALALNPSFPEAHTNKGNVLLDLKMPSESLKAYDKALEINPNYIFAHLNRGCALRDLNHFDDALKSYDLALESDPRLAEAHYNRAGIMGARSCFEEAIQSYGTALECRPDFATARWARGAMLLLLGRFEEGWQDYEARWEDTRSSVMCGTRRFATSQPLWLGGNDLDGKTILLHGEQGLGDSIQFSRYATLVAELGAQVILEVPQPLVRLLATVKGVSQVVAHDEKLPPYDYQCPLMSLPLAFKTTLNTIPAPVPYLRPDAVKLGYWRELLGEKRHLRVGLVWAGSLNPGFPKYWTRDSQRNIPLLQLAPLANPGIHFFSLQKGEKAVSELQQLRLMGWDGPDIQDFTCQLEDFGDTAACISQLDLVISVDTAVAHLAGALGKPVWILNRFDTCWRWLLDRADSPWYPTARLYRQISAGDWNPVVQQVAMDLASYARAAY